MTSNLTEKREENENSGDCEVDGSHRGVSVVMNRCLSVGGAIQRLEFGD